MSTTLLALNTTARSTTVAIPAGSTYSFVLYTSAGGSLPAMGGAAVYADTPGEDVKLAELDAKHNYSASIQGPIDVVVKIPASGVSLGVVQYP